MGSKKITRLLNTIGSSSKLIRCTSLTVDYHQLQKLNIGLICNNANQYHLSSPKSKEIQDQEAIIKISKDKDPKQELLSGSLKDESSMDKKGILSEIGKSDDFRTSGSNDLIAESFKQKLIEKIEPLSKIEGSKYSVQQGVPKNVGKLKGRVKKTMESEIGKRIKINMMNAMKKEMKGSYSIIRKKQLEQNASDDISFSPKPFSGEKETSSTTLDIKLRPLDVKDNSFNPLITTQAETSQTKDNVVQIQENIPKEPKIVEGGTINKEKIIINEMKKANTSLETEVVGLVSIDEKQMKKPEENELEKERRTPKDTEMLESESITETNPNTSENNSKTFQNRLKSQETPKVFEVNNIGFGSNTSNFKTNKNMNMPFNMIRNSKIKEGNKTSVKQEQPRIVEIDSPFTKKTMFNTLLDPIAKSSKKQAQNRGVSSQSGDNFVKSKNDSGKEAGGSKSKQIDQKMPEPTKIVEKLNNILGVSNEKIGASTDLLKENVEKKPKKQVVQITDSISNKLVDQKIPEPSKIVEKLNILGMGQEKIGASTHLLKKNAEQKSKLEAVQISDSISNRLVDQKIPEPSKIVEKLNVLGMGQEKIGASTELVKGNIERKSNENTVQRSDSKPNKQVDQKIPEQPKIVDKLNNLGIGKEKIGASTDLLKESAERNSIKESVQISNNISNLLFDQMIPEQLKVVDKLNILGIEEDKSEASTELLKGSIELKSNENTVERSDSKPNQKVDQKIPVSSKSVHELKENVEQKSNQKSVQRSDSKSNQQVHQKIPEQPTIIDKLYVPGIEKDKSGSSVDLLKENAEKWSNKKTVERSHRLSNQQAGQKITEPLRVVDELNKENVEQKSNKKTVQRLNSKSKQPVQQKIPEQPKTVDKLNVSGIGEEKSNKDSNTGEVEPKLKRTLKVKYRIKETLKEKLQNLKMLTTDRKSEVANDKVNPQLKLDKTENLKILTTDRMHNVANEKVDPQWKPEKRVIQLDQKQHFAVTKKQEELPKLITAMESIEKHLQQKSIVFKQDLNEGGTLAFDSSYVISQLAKSRQSLSFEEIPGPKLMRICSNIVNALPIIGTQTISSLMRSYNRLHLSHGHSKFVTNRMKPIESLFNSYGDIVCLNIPLCGDIILVDKPELIHEVYRQRDMSQMLNSSFDSLNEVYNVLNKKKIRMDSGMEEQMTCVIEHFDLKNLFWSENRYHDSLETISDQLVDRITITRDIHNEVSKYFIKDLNKWSLECMMQVLFATEIGSLRSDSKLGYYESEKILKFINDATDALRDCESGMQLWRVYETSSFTKLTKSIQDLERFLVKHIPLLKHDTKLEQRLEILQTNLESKQNASSLISGLILSGYVDVDKLLKICMETMLIAVNTTSTSLGFILYHLARNQEKQKILHKELMSVLPNKSSKLNPDVLRELPYLNACVQETLRLKHPIPYSLMRLQRSIVLHKYYVPAGTWVMTANEVACLREENFPDAELFTPERWLESSADLYQDTISPLLEAQFEPFLGRDWLQKQLLIGTAKVIRNFNVKYRYGEIGKEGEFLSKPTKPFQFEFLEQRV